MDLNQDICITITEQRLQVNVPLFPSKNTFIHFDVFDFKLPTRSRSWHASPAKFQASFEGICRKSRKDRVKEDGSKHGQSLTEPTTPSSQTGPQSGSARRATLRRLPPGATTLVVRNIPARYTVASLLEEWIPDGTFDMVHLPYNSREKRFCGYAFINFLTPESALEFQAKKHGTYLRYGCGKHLDCAVAEVQGFEANLKLLQTGRRLLRTPYMELLPAIFRGRARVPTNEVLDMIGLKGLRLRTWKTMWGAPSLQDGAK